MSIEAGYFRVQPWPEHHSKMHVCPRDGCENGMVSPIRWDRTSSSSTWTARLRCGECHTFYEGDFNQKQIDAYEEVLEEQAEVIKAGLQRIMEDYAETFTVALADDQIFPEDF